MSNHTRERFRYDRLGNEDRNSSRNPRHESLKSTPDKGRWDSREFIKFNQKNVQNFLEKDATETFNRTCSKMK